MDTTAEVDFELLKRWLKHGDIRELAEINLISKSLAYKILKGESKNFRFLQAALERAVENKAKVDRLLAQLKAQA